MTTTSQSASSQPTASQRAFTILCEDRWQVYHRLKELDIEAQCQGFHPLKASIHTATEAIQVWSIVRRISTPRAELAATLENSWRERAYTRHLSDNRHEA